MALDGLCMPSLCAREVHEDGTRYISFVGSFSIAIWPYVWVYGLDGGAKFLHLGIAHTVASHDGGIHSFSNL